jgi:hypothetical protein
MNSETFEIATDQQVILHAGLKTDQGRRFTWPSQVSVRRVNLYRVAKLEIQQGAGSCQHGYVDA